MKKIISLLAAGLLAFGLTSCSGDLFDAESIDFTKLYLRGDMNDWGTTPLIVEAGDGYDAKVTFTATVSPQQADIASDDWGIAYRKVAEGSADDVAFTAEDVGKKKAGTKKMYHGGGMTNATIETVVGAEYTLYIKGNAGFIEMWVEQGELPLDCYFVADNAISKMELVEKNKYKFKATADTDGKLGFSLFDGTNSWGIDAAQLDKDLTLTKDKTINLTGLAAGKDYVITFDITNKEAPVVNVVQDIFACYVIGDISGDFVKMDVLTEKGYRAYTFKYTADMTAWAGGNGKINFKINDIPAWSGSTLLFAGVDLEINGDYEEKASDDNATCSGLEVGHTYTILADITDTSSISVRLVEGPALFITGDMDGWGWTLPALDYDANGAYYTFTEAKDNCSFKVKTVPNWANDADCVWADATVTEAGVAAGANAAVGGGGNGVVSAAKGDKVYFWYDYENSCWMAKLVKKA